MNGMGARMLFGGALSATMPQSARDISELREIPDNQEVFAHSSTDQSFIVELLEYQGHVADSDAARYHFEDVAGSNEAAAHGASEVRAVELIPKDLLAMTECSSAWLLTGTQQVSKFNEEARNTVNIHLGLFRLPQFATDILVTFNDPIIISTLSSSAGVAAPGAVAPWTMQDFQQLLRSLKILDAGVFG
ncbi:ran guanine nucleotide release factor [Brienomyrus brachyistius]|uniref:ran guanine nucleotide release factor n=1 Tax=Brienomyrus brachyistius TaxID=42636 RepID=UPI0020B353B1|nr:ran guanine nucleotide release factor [Brienomyrus brachyistius]XP_048857435.1 ran guanine nucleotide release factor [Brienomyrus brachyistius]